MLTSTDTWVNWCRFKSASKSIHVYEKMVGRATVQSKKKKIVLTCLSWKEKDHLLKFFSSLENDKSRKQILLVFKPSPHMKLRNQLCVLAFGHTTHKNLHKIQYKNIGKSVKNDGQLVSFQAVLEKYSTNANHEKNDILWEWFLNWVYGTRNKKYETLK